MSQISGAAFSPASGANPSFQSVSETLTPAGATLASATLIVSRYTTLTGSAAQGTGVRMPPATGSGNIYIIHNPPGSNGYYNVFPSSGEQVENWGASTASRLDTFMTFFLVDTASSLWRCFVAPFQQDGANRSILGGVGWQIPGALVGNGTNSLKGTTTNDNATAGYYGELLGPISRLKSNATAMTSPNTLNVCTTASITLTAGDWDVRGMVGFVGDTGTSITLLKAAVSKTSATLPASDTSAVPTAGEVTTEYDTAANVIGAGTVILPIPSYRVSLAASTDLWLVAAATFSVNTLSAYGSMQARRVR